MLQAVAWLCQKIVRKCLVELETVEKPAAISWILFLCLALRFTFHSVVSLYDKGESQAFELHK